MPTPRHTGRSLSRALALLLLHVTIPAALAVGQPAGYDNGNTPAGDGEALTTDTGPGGTDSLEENPDGSVPVDGGISLLLAAGAAYGGRRLWTKRTLS